MGKVAMTYRLMPESTDFDFDGLDRIIASKLPGGSELRDRRIVPIAFGLRSFEVMIVAEDREGTSDNVEKALGGINGIQSVESIETTLL